MDKNTYLQTFKNGLSIFEESYQQKQVLDLEQKISKKVASGKTEEEALTELGDVAAQIRLIYQKNHVAEKAQKTSFFAEKYESLLDIIHRIIDVMSKNSAKANMKIIFDILILIFLVCIIKIPFILVKDLVESLLAFLSSPFINSLWNFIVELSYVFIAIIVFLNIFRRWFQNLKIQK